MFHKTCTNYVRTASISSSEFQNVNMGVRQDAQNPIMCIVFMDDFITISRSKMYPMSLFFPTRNFRYNII